ncbi:MAG TPA: ornithine carbamoyltransferase [Candidatus Glassbacteria bacterium]|nr:ornithine carbamoyltransferase [Candidatus Glassbacteria bacterium]
MKRDFISISDFTPEELKQTLDLAVLLKKIRKTPKDVRPLVGRSMAMIFEKPSLRTRVTFELAMVELGGHALELQSLGIQLGERESVPDVARNLERWVDVVAARVYHNETVSSLAANMDVPVINALCDLEHPCQAVADMLTLRELAPRKYPRVRLAYVGDGNNVCHSLMLICASLGVDLAVGTPKGYEPNAEFVDKTRELIKRSRAAFSLVNDPVEAVEGADFVYTDVWASMGQEEESEERKKIFKNFQLNKKLLKHAAADYCVLHCLPAHRGEEITDEVMDGPHSRVFIQAENRLHAQKAIILKLLARGHVESLIKSKRV